MKRPTLDELNKIEDFAGHPEHYKLLAWVSLQFNDITIVEIGTHKGYGTQALSHNKKNRVISFDIKDREGSIETPPNAEKKKVYNGYMDEVVKASIIFYDAKHEGKEEREFFDELVKRDWRGILILDDIHFNDPMREFWESITLPKEDWTKVGHFPSGTGVVFFFRKMIKHSKGIDFYIEKIKNNQPFKFLRFGDGEFLVAKGNTNKSIAKGEHAIFPEIIEDIRYILAHLKEGHYCGLQSLSLSLPNINYLVPEWDWYNSDVFHHASANGELGKLFEALKGKEVVIIGNKRMRDIDKYIKYTGFIKVRMTDCYWDKEMVLKEMEKYKSGTIFLFCASRLSVPAIYHSKRDDCTMLDMGSVFDPYIGIKSRRYHENLNIL